MGRLRRSAYREGLIWRDLEDCGVFVSLKLTKHIHDLVLLPSGARNAHGNLFGCANKIMERLANLTNSIERQRALRGSPGVVHKIFVGKAGDDPLEYVMSDNTVDRMGDVIEPDGWSLANFKKNPIALFGHDSKFFIGNWANVRVEKGELRGRMSLLDAVSDRLREIHAAVNAKILRAVSVGFREIQSEPLQGSKGGIRYIKQDLIECSLVGIPANPNALAVAKSLNISRDTISMIFADKGAVRATIQPRAIAEAKLAKLETEQWRLMRRLCWSVEDLALARKLFATLKEMAPSEARSQEIATVLQQMRYHEITVKAFSNLLGVNHDELQRLEQQAHSLRTARAHVASRRKR
jgi:HK97 family phage prohead protease